MLRSFSTVLAALLTLVCFTAMAAAQPPDGPPRGDRGPDGPPRGERRPDGPPRGERGPGGPPSADAIFRHIDQNGDGSISKEEFERAHHQLAERIREHLHGGPRPGEHAAQPPHDAPPSHERAPSRKSHKARAHGRSHAKHGHHGKKKHHKHRHHGRKHGKHARSAGRGPQEGMHRPFGPPRPPMGGFHGFHPPFGGPWAHHRGPDDEGHRPPAAHGGPRPDAMHRPLDRDDDDRRPARPPMAHRPEGGRPGGPPEHMRRGDDDDRPAPPHRGPRDRDDDDGPGRDKD